MFEETIHDKVKRLDRLKAEHQRLLGKYESAKEAHQEVLDSCRSKKIDPDNIDALITKLQKAYDEETEKVDREISAYQEQLKKFL